MHHKFQIPPSVQCGKSPGTIKRERIIHALIIKVRVTLHENVEQRIRQTEKRAVHLTQPALKLNPTATCSTTSNFTKKTYTGFIRILKLFDINRNKLQKPVQLIFLALINHR